MTTKIKKACWLALGLVIGNVLYGASHDALTAALSALVRACETDRRPARMRTQCEAELAVAKALLAELETKA